MRTKQEKYIDLNQFKKDKTGKILWKDNVGKTIEFYYNNKKHTIEIIEYLSRNYLKIKIDNNVYDRVHNSKIKNLSFENLFYEPDFLYKKNEIVRNLKIIDTIRIPKKTTRGSGKTYIKGYLCKCLIDDYEFQTSEYDLKSGHGCPVCANHVIIKGINDIATTSPELVCFFKNIEDAYTHSESSSEKVKVVCPFCMSEKYMYISELNKYGRVTCDKCCDGISYPNKFAHELFSQLSNQYIQYDYEFSPEWAGKLRYDNHIILLDGKELLIEMDGAFHYLKSNSYITNNDELKNNLADSHNMKIIRIDCNYDKTGNRFNYIKNNIIKSLSDYFDLSLVNWDKCNSIGISNYLFEVIDYYNKNTKIDLHTISDHFKISMETLYNYLYVGENLGICKYIRNDPNRVKNSKPVAMYDLNNNLIGIFKSAKIIEETFPELNFSHRCIRKSITDGKIYKNHIFSFVTYKDYQAY